LGFIFKRFLRLCDMNEIRLIDEFLDIDQRDNFRTSLRSLPKWQII